MKIELNENTLFTADTHFDHKFAAQMRHFDNTDDMNRAIVSDWNNKVSEQDTIIHAGDFCWHKRTIKNILPRLNGRIILVLGNHDRSMEKEYIHYGVETCLMATIKIQDVRIECCHFPLWAWDRMHHGAWHIHGHQHGDPTGIKGRIHDVGIDNNKGIISFAELRELIGEKEIRNHHGA